MREVTSDELLTALLCGDSPVFHPNTGQRIEEGTVIKLSPSRAPGWRLHGFASCVGEEWWCRSARMAGMRRVRVMAG